jgi:thioredoxin 1
MKSRSIRLAVVLCSLSVIFLFARQATVSASVPQQIPVKGMVTMVDIGAGSCIPCKIMAPILEKMKNEYAGRAEVIFLDVRYDRTAGERFGIQAIPTQIFFDKDGKEVLRHVGVMTESQIIGQFKQMGVK